MLASASVALGIAGAAAQPYPSRPITLIVPYPPGGPPDKLARIFAERMRGTLGQPVVIENVGGGAGSIGVGARRARGAERLHHQFRQRRPARASTAVVFKLHYDVLTDFEPVALMVDVADVAPVRRQAAGEEPEGADRLAEGEPGQGQRSLWSGPAARRICAASICRTPPAPNCSSCRTRAPARRCRIVMGGQVDADLPRASATRRARGGRQAARLCAPVARRAGRARRRCRPPTKRACRASICRSGRRSGCRRARPRTCREAQCRGGRGAGRPGDARKADRARRGDSAARPADAGGAARTSSRPRSTSGGRSSRRPTSSRTITALGDRDVAQGGTHETSVGCRSRCSPASRAPPRKPIRTSRSPSSCRSRPAGRPTRWRASWASA